MTKNGDLLRDENFLILHQFLVNHYGFSDRDSHDVFGKFQFVEIKKNTLLHQRNEVCQYAYFICQGCLRTFFTNRKGEENTRHIAFENHFVSAFSSFITQTPSLENVQALEHSKLLKIKQSDFFHLVNTHETFSKLYLRSLEQAQVLSTWRLESMLSMTARERYRDLRERMPEVILRLSNKQVASFLGITQESLSRLKAQK
ncbi:Crp/Fnr family transcriptional regulator [Chryseolinea soli]|uniref:Crp/Fnr family transcriptional regulator n=1 Tax=Chryseolinea soli TaxID=2321403 RepID=A0A385SUU3_9BACT|nr:Crp/Fnr family transcriptional regulator [Chryseolinea soli]AYB34684.1 Crp/Fnr family transcriptional regulator [Chryseolinea soli]